jgi:hypothetical protein
MYKALHGTALLAGALLVLMISVGPSDLGGPLGKGWGRFVAVVAIAVVGCVLYSWWMYYIKPRSEPAEKDKFPRHQVESHKVQELHGLLKNGRVPTSEQARVFAMAIIEPTLIRRRMVEDYTPQGRTLARSTKVEVHLPSRVWKPGKDGDSIIYLPTAVVPKGVLLDGFRVFNSSDETMTCLTYRDYLMLVAGTLRVLLTAAYRPAPGDPLPPEATTAEFAALAAIIQRVPACGHHTPDLTAANAIARLDAPHAPSRMMASLFVEKLITNYAVVTVVVPPGSGRFSFSWAQNFIPDLKVTGSRTRRLSMAGLTRIGLGAKPVDLTLDIADAGTAQSYHLHVNAPEGLYLARQEALGMQGLLARWATDAPTLPHCRFRRRLGQPHAHFYSRYMPRARADEKPRVRFRFFEVPPGTLMRAAVTALACAAIVWTVAFVSSQNPAVDTDAPAFLLAFPALAAAWLGFEAPSQRLLEGTLSTRICLMVSAALSITSSGLFMAHKAQAEGDFDWPMLPTGVTVLGVTDLTWAVVTGIALVNATLISYKCLIRTWEFMRLASRTDQ